MVAVCRGDASDGPAAAAPKGTLVLAYQSADRLVLECALKQVLLDLHLHAEMLKRTLEKKDQRKKVRCKRVF